MKWLIPVLMAAGIIAAAIVPAWQDRAQVTGRVTVTTCAEDLGADAAGSTSLTWRLRLADDTGGMLLDLTDEELIALGFDRHAVSMVGQNRVTGMEWPKPRPIWVRLRPSAAQGGRLTVDSMAPWRTRLPGDPNSIVVRGRVGFSYRGLPSPRGAGDSAGTGSPRPPAVIRVDLLELIPGLLHLTRTEDALLRGIQAGPGCAGSPARAVIATGRHGGLWVERLTAP
jgi:hypothetical protein